MRIEELVLDPFGSFEKRRIAFQLGRRFHLVVGSNEAGKSTSLRALMALLYGMGEFAKDTEGHPKARLEGRFVTDTGDTVDVVRTKKGRKDEVVDGQGKPVAESVLDDLRGDVSLDTFRSAHAMTLAALQTGSREMLAAKDDIGASLLQARFGRLDVLAASGELEKEQKEIFTTMRSKKKLLLALDEVDKAKAAAELATTSPESLEAQKRELEEAEAQATRLRNEFESVRVELDRAHAIVRAGERVEKQRRLSLLMDELGDVPLATDDATRILAAASSLAQGQEARLAKLAERDQAERDLARLAPADPIIRFSDEIAWLKDAADQDRADELELARLKNRLAELEGAAASVDADALARRHNDLAQLLAEANEAAHRLQTAATKQELALKELGDIEAEFEGAATTTPSVTHFGMAAATLGELIREFERTVELADAAQLAERTQRARLQTQLATKARAPGLDDVQFLAFARLLPRAALTDATYMHISRERERVASLDAEAAKTTSALDELQQRRKQADETKALPTEEALLEARVLRKAELERLLRNPDAQAAQALSLAIDHADTLVDQLRAHAAEVAERAHLDDEITTLAQRLSRIEGELVRAKDECARLEEGLRKLFPSHVASESTDALRGLAAWGEELRPLASTLDELIAVAEHHAEKRSLAAGALTRALQLGSAEAPIEPEALLARARRTLEGTREREAAEEQQKHRRSALEKARASRTRDVLSLQGERKAASDKWKALAEAQGLPSDVVEARSVIAAALKAKESIARREALTDECKRTEARRATFMDRFEGLVKQFAGPTNGDTPTLPQIIARLSAAMNTESARRDLSRALERAELELGAQHKALAWAEEVLENARIQAKVRRPEEVVALAEQAKQKHALAVELRVLRGELAHLGLVTPEDVARAETDVPRLTTRFDAVSDELQRAERRAAGVRMGVESFQQVKDGAAEALALAEAYRTDARALARQWAVSALASQLLKDAMTTLRDEAEGPIFEKASAFLSQMTGGRYTRLRVELGAARAQAIALETAQGETVQLERLSDGTRDQLYLAVRLAFLVLQRESGGPALPLVLDDVLTAFDDTRARATLKLLFDLSDRLEIIYFSHHEHMLELVESCFPGEDASTRVDVIRLERNS